jgi:hypothetical protein
MWSWWRGDHHAVRFSSLCGLRESVSWPCDKLDVPLFSNSMGGTNVSVGASEFQGLAVLVHNQRPVVPRMILDEKRQRHLNYLHKSGTRIRMQVGKWVKKRKANMTLEQSRQARSTHADASELFVLTSRQPLAP